MIKNNKYEGYSDFDSLLRRDAIIQIANELERIRKIFQSQKTDINRSLKIMEAGFNQATTERPQKPRKKARKATKRHTSRSVHDVKM